jgi:ABC-type uncharacterized transport system substrate-binding protein
MQFVPFRFMVFFLLSGLLFTDASADTNYKITIVQHVKYIGFEQTKQGFKTGLDKLGYGSKVEIIEDFNAENNILALENKVGELSRRKDIDLILSLGTHTTKRFVKSIHKTPFVFTSIGDPITSGIVTDWKSSGRNYTGVEAPEYYSKVVRLMHTFVPFKRLGMVYLKGSPSHEAGIAQIKHLAKELGFDLICEGFPLRNKDKVPYPKKQIRKRLEQALANVCLKADAFFVQTSTTFTKEFPRFLSAFKKHRIISAGDPTNIHKGLVMGIGKNAHRFGEQCAQYAIQILEGTAPSDLPMDVGVKLSIQINLAAAKLIGYNPPFELVSAADNIVHKIGKPSLASSP